MGVVFDSSIFIATERGRLDAVGFLSQFGSEPLFVAAVTLAELAHGVARANTPERRSVRQAFVTEIEDSYPLLLFGRAEALEYGKLWADLAIRGTPIGTHDQMIAAAARCRSYSVATLNVSDFSRVHGLKVIDASPFLRPKS